MRTVLFLDIDGVFSIPNTENIEERKESWPGCGVLYPIPMAMQLLRAIDDNRQLQPVWLSAWNGNAFHWNARANTRDWPVAYHLSRRQETYAFKRFPEFRMGRIDRKLIAARYYIRDMVHKPVIWMEDGFADETRAWAKETPQVKLVDTTIHLIRACLLAYHTNPEQAAHDFIRRWL